MPLMSSMTSASAQCVRPLGYRPNIVDFDGATNLFLNAGLSGASDSKLMTIAAWVKADTDGALARFIQSDGASPANVRFSKGASNNAVVQVGDTAGNAALSIASSTDSIQAADGYVNVLVSVDMSDTAKRHLYINDASDLTVTTYVDATLDFTKADWAIGHDGGGGIDFNGQMSDLLVWFGTYVDFSVTANRRMFVSPDLKPITPYQAIATLGSPIIGMVGPTSTWQDNLLGTGGAFSVTAGALTTAPTYPW